MGKQGEQIAIIDLGTNTFHILCVQLDKQAMTWEILYKERIYIKLASGGIQFIEDEAKKRALEAMLKFRKIIDELQITTIRAIGTAAMRRAANAGELIDQIREETGIEVKVISGDEEAKLIADGISLAITDTRRPYLIMDIGGGSVEFILCDKNGDQQIVESFPIGVAILFKKFHLSDPISDASIDDMNLFLMKKLSRMIKRVQEIDELSLVGASGTFEVMEDILNTRRISPFATEFDPKSYIKVYESIIKSDLVQRLARTDIPDSRADLIVVASHLIHFILKHISFHSIIISQLAMKEGVIKESLQSDI